MFGKSSVLKTIGSDLVAVTTFVPATAIHVVPLNKAAVIPLLLFPVSAKKVPEIWILLDVLDGVIACDQICDPCDVVGVPADSGIVEFPDIDPIGENIVCLTTDVDVFDIRTQDDPSSLKISAVSVDRNTEPGFPGAGLETKVPEKNDDVFP